MQVAVRVEQHFKFRPSDRCIRGVDPQYRKNYEHGTTFAVCCCYTCLDHCHRKWARYLLYICRGGHGSRSSRREAPQVPTNALASIVPHTQPTGLHERNKSLCSAEEHINARMGLCEASKTPIAKTSVTQRNHEPVSSMKRTAAVSRSSIHVARGCMRLACVDGQHDQVLVGELASACVGLEALPLAELLPFA